MQHVWYLFVSILFISEISFCAGRVTGGKPRPCALNVAALLAAISESQPSSAVSSRENVSEKICEPDAHRRNASGRFRKIESCVTRLTLQSEVSKSAFNAACRKLRTFKRVHGAVVLTSGFLSDDFTQRTPKVAVLLYNDLIKTLQKIAQRNGFSIQSIPKQFDYTGRKIQTGDVCPPNSPHEKSV